MKEISSISDVDYVARAPPGMEVEELSRKEIIKALRARVPVDQAENNARQAYEDRGRFRRVEPVPARTIRRDAGTQPIKPSMQVPQPAPRVTVDEPPIVTGIASYKIPEELYGSLSELENTARARLYDAGNGLKSEILVKDILPSIESSSDVHAVVFDGVVTQRLVDLAASKGIKVLLGVKVGNVFNRPVGMTIGGKK